MPPASPLSSSFVPPAKERDSFPALEAWYYREGVDRVYAALGLAPNEFLALCDVLTKRNAVQVQPDGTYLCRGVPVRAVEARVAWLYPPYRTLFRELVARYAALLRSSVPSNSGAIAPAPAAAKRPRATPPEPMPPRPFDEGIFAELPGLRPFAADLRGIGFDGISLLVLRHYMQYDLRKIGIHQDFRAALDQLGRLPTAAVELIRSHIER